VRHRHRQGRHGLATIRVPSEKVLAQLARTAARRKISQLEEALEGAEFFTADHAALLAHDAGAHFPSDRRAPWSAPELVDEL